MTMFNLTLGRPVPQGVIAFQIPVPLSFSVRDRGARTVTQNRGLPIVDLSVLNPLPLACSPFHSLALHQISPQILRNVIGKIEKVWNTRNAHGTMNVE